MGAIAAEARRFRRSKEQQAAIAAARVAFFLNCGMDLEAGLELTPDAREALVARLRRLIERERLRGGRRHWSYDLNRHIALKQALDLIVGSGEGLPDAKLETAPPGRRLLSR